MSNKRFATSEDEIKEGNKRVKECAEIEGSVVLMKKKILDVDNVFSSCRDCFDELGGHGVSFQLISSVHGDPEKGGKLGKVACLENWITQFSSLTANDVKFKIKFDWDEDLGLPGALIVKNNHHSEFYLKTVTLNDVPRHGRVHFLCNSWVYPTNRYNYDRVFFANKTYLPSETPMSLLRYREEELVNLRGNGKGELQVWDRVYDYAYYNDLGNPDEGLEHARPVLGGSTQFPYPRRGRTGRPPTKTDPETESMLPVTKTLDIYVPRDERFSHLKMSDAVGYGLKSAYQFLFPEVKGLFDGTYCEFESFEQLANVYEGGISLPDITFLGKIKECIPFETLKELCRSDGEQLLKFPMPQVIKVDKSAWRTDEEFAREMLAGINPVMIRRLLEFPPTSKLDPKKYGNQTSSMTYEHIAHNLNGLTIEELMTKNKLFILDHHDDIMPFIARINTTSTKAYATRTLLLLKDDGTLKPLAIELSLPNPKGDQFGAVSKVYAPAQSGVEGSIWELAKAYVAVNDSGYHQLISHWLKTHAAIEPFIIASNRQLSVLHPIFKLLHPHFKDTMNVNALAREILINDSGALQFTLFPSIYSMELSSAVYKNWVFPEQSLPADLIKRGVAVEDAKSPNGIRLIIEDYPYAVDGLEIWSAIKTWVEDYCAFYYKTDEMVCSDAELQSWWHELRTKGHGDKKNEPWWPKMDTRKNLVETCTIIIWLASAYHAAINFGQYPYGGYLPNRPSISRRFMPEPGTLEFAELESNPEKAYLKTITAKLQTLLGISLIEVLSRHTSDEVYLGNRDPEWTNDAEALEAFGKFGEKLEEIERRITEMNVDGDLKNRAGPVKMPYTLLMPSSEVGLTGKGIPNSVSI